MIILEQSVKIEKDEVEAYEENGWKVTLGSDGNYYAEKPSNNKNQQSSQENKKAEDPTKKIEKDEVEAYEDKGWKVTLGSDGNYYAEKPSNNNNQQSSQENKKDEKSPKKEQCPSTPFTNSTESDAFRTWLLKNYPYYEKKPNPYNVSAAPKPKYTNTTALRCAYKDKGKEYEAFLNSSTNNNQSSSSDSKSSNVDKDIQDLQQSVRNLYSQKCNPWVSNNWFERDFKGSEDQKAKEFYNFVIKDSRVSTSIERKIQDYDSCEKKHIDYVNSGLTHLSPWIFDAANDSVYGKRWGITDEKWPILYNIWIKLNKGEITKDPIPEGKIIRKKLLELKEMKTIKESIRKKLSSKTEKIDVISENLYKVAGKFYNENYNEFFKKFEKLTENYKKSKLFLKEDSSESFNRALNKVFKGDESKLKKEAIPYFLNKLGLEGKIREKVKNELNAKYDDNNVGDLFLDCWADIVVQAFKDNAKSEISEPSNVMDAIEKIMVSKIDSPEFDYQLKKEICKMLKPAQEERQTKVQDLAKKLAQSIIDSSEA